MLDHHIMFQTHPGAGGSLAVITLNRPEALNAMSANMFSRLSRQLKEWASDDTIKAVLIKSSSAKAFCAGGDIRSIYQAGESNVVTTLPYFELEYAVNQLLFNYPKPYIALLDGITMGGGAGISLPGGHCVATENFSWAMPEAKIGFFVDVGATYFLARCPDFVGHYLALSSRSINAVTAFSVDLVQYVVSSQDLVNIEQDLLQTPLGFNADQTVKDIIQAYVHPVEQVALQEYYPLISRCFSSCKLSEIIETLEIEGCEWADGAIKDLKMNSPLSLHIILRQLESASCMEFAQVIEQDLMLAENFIGNPNFYEGVRALMIDKDNQPRWRYPSINEVSADVVDGFFATHVHRV